MIKKQKKLIITFAALFVVLLVVYFAVIRPLTATTDDSSSGVELLDGEVAITAKTSNFYIFQPLSRSEIQSIEVKNEFGGYKVYRDASDKFQLDGYMGLKFDDELFSSLVVTTGTPTAMMRVATDLDDAGLVQYGLDNPQAEWIVTSTSGEEFVIEVGDELVTEGGYYVKYAPRNAVYILSTTLADTVLQPAYKLLSPLLTAGMSTNNYFYVDEFTIWKNEELFVNIYRTPEDQMTSTDAIVENYMTYPKPESENASDKALYEMNSDLYYQALYNFIALEGDEVMAFRPEDEVFAQYGLENPKYMIRYVFEDYEFVVLVSERQEGGGYYACSNLYGYNLICHVEDEKLNWLEKDSFGWISPTPFFVNITTVKRITIEAENVDVDFTLTHGTDTDGNATLDVVENNSGTVIKNADVNNFRQYYKTMLNLTNQEYATLSDEDRLALMNDDSKIVMTLTCEGVDGSFSEYKFYKYVEESTGKISGGKIFVSVNGAGEFYTTNDLVDKVINDTSRVLKGLDVDAYGQR